MAEWEWDAAAVSQLLDVQIYAAGGEPIGKVDDLEFTVPDDDGAPVLTALLSGPTAFGPRVGGLIGLSIWAIGRRMSPSGGSPVRIPLTEVQRVNRREIRLRESARELGVHRTADRTRENIITKDPGWFTMRTLDLLGSDTIDTDGRRLGRVHDIRLESGATPLDGSSEPAFAISALVVGSAGYAHRLGYGRGQMAGPWPLTAFFRRMAKRSVVIPWSDVEDGTDGTVTVRPQGHERSADEEAT